jgi:hypothetical protein
MGFVNPLKKWKRILTDWAGDFEERCHHRAALKRLAQGELLSIHRLQCEIRRGCSRGQSSHFILSSKDVTKPVHSYSILDDLGRAQNLLRQPGQDKVVSLSAPIK